MAESSNPEKDLFLKALELDSPDKRAFFLAEACGADENLRLQVAAMLKAHASPDSFLEKPAVALGITVDASAGQSDAHGAKQRPTAEPGMRVGPYKLLQQIGEGGMGVVFMAEQHEPIRRMVALKIIKPGMDSAQVLARFEAERQALALMDHPNIARVLDAGTTTEGRPYFVMELVKGVPITQFCDERRLTPRQRLELFMPVCQAVQHAHQKAIIHRDLKPSNVLIALYDGKPVPKVIDFGIAKATGQQLTERTLFTGFGSIVGTLEYMSPEQAELNQIDIDTRSDIYSLGVLLYELLTGTTPLSRERLKAGAFLEMLRLVREEEPPKPSTRLSTSATLASLSEQRHTEPKKLTKLVRGDIDWIVMKALDKDRDRRYETAAGFAQDIERYLGDEPVQASPPSTWYRTRKFVKRNRGAVAAASLVLLVLLGGVIGTTWGMLLAEKRLTQVKKGNDILISIFDDLDPRSEEKDGKPLRAILGERLDQAAKDLEGESAGPHLEVPRLQFRLGKALVGLGYPEKAIPLFTKAHAASVAHVGPKHPTTLNCAIHLAGAYRNAGKLGQALPLYEEILEMCKAAEGPEHISTLVSMNNLAGAYRDAGKRHEALALYEAVFQVCKANPKHPLMLTSTGNLAVAYADLGKHDLALPLYEEVLKAKRAKFGPDHLDTLLSMSNLGIAYDAIGKSQQAIELLEEVLKLRKAKLGPDHPETLTTMADLANVYARAGKREQAMPLHEETLKMRKAKLGPEHPHTLKSMNYLAGAYRDTGKREQALALFEETLRLRKLKLGLDHPDTLTSMNNLADMYGAKKRAQAIALFEEVLTLRKIKLGLDHPDTLATMNSLALSYHLADKVDKALPLYEETLKLRKVRLGLKHPDTLMSMKNLAFGYLDARRLDEALPLYEETYRLRNATLGPEHPTTLDSLVSLAGAYNVVGKLDQAVPLYEEAFELRRKKLGPEHDDTLTSMNSLAAMYTAVRKYTEADMLSQELLAIRRRKLPADDPKLASALAQIGWNWHQARRFTEAETALRECLTIREKKEPEEWRTFKAKALLGGTLLGQKKYADAEPLLLTGYEGMKQREAKGPLQGQIDLMRAVDGLVQLYEATENKQKADEWRKKVPK